MRTIIALVVSLGLLLGSSAIPAGAQTVEGAASPASCVQNVGNGELACGSGSVANPGTGATAIGINAKATADAAMAFGFEASAASIAAMAFGKGTSAVGDGAVAVGQGASSTGMFSTAIGFAGRALANDTVAVGDTATASSNFSTALGANTTAGFASSTALGSGAQATAANQMMLGTATNILAAPGIVSAASKAAQKGKVLMVTIDGNGNIATAAVPACRCPIVRNPKLRHR
jgi:trimeric autotransporter adhesin